MRRRTDSSDAFDVTVKLLLLLIRAPSIAPRTVLIMKGAKVHSIETRII